MFCSLKNTPLFSQLESSFQPSRFVSSVFFATFSVFVEIREELIITFWAIKLPTLPICSDAEVRFKLQVETSGLILELGLPAELRTKRRLQ